MNGSRELYDIELGGIEPNVPTLRHSRSLLRRTALGRILLGVIIGSAVWCLISFEFGARGRTILVSPEYSLGATLPQQVTPTPIKPPSSPVRPSYALNLPSNPEYSNAFEEDTLMHRGYPSSAFAPMVVRDCTHLTPTWFAPCVAFRSPFSDRTYAEELIYPDFGLPQPVFVNAEHQAKWKAHLGSIDDRAVYRAGYLLYKSQHGQNFVCEESRTRLMPRSSMMSSTSHRACSTSGSQTRAWAPTLV